MKTQKKSDHFKGFTLMELMVAMAITTIIITILVSITSISLDTWNRSRAETRAARQAKTLVDTMARDLEALVATRGNNLDWLFAQAAGAIGPENAQNSSATELNFYTAATDRYNGQLGDRPMDKGGDVSSVAYRLIYKDPIKNKEDDTLATFVVYRMLVNPDDTYREFLGAEDLESAWAGKERAIAQPKNFVCENIYQFSLTFNVAVEIQKGNLTETQIVPMTITNSSSTAETRELRINGAGILTRNFSGSGQVTEDMFKAGKVISVDLSLSVISDSGLEQLRRRKMEGSAKAEFLQKNSFQYTKQIQMPKL